MGESEVRDLSTRFRDEIYEITSEQLSVFQGCNSGPEELVKHLSTSYVLTLCYLSDGDLRSGFGSKNVGYVNCVDEVVFDCIGLPSCWSMDSGNYFLEKKMHEIKD